MRATAAALLLFVTGCSELIGSGVAVSERRAVGEYKGVAVRSGLRARLGVGPQDVVITTDDNLIRLIETKVENGLLVIQVPSNVALRFRSFEASVTSPELNSIDGSGGAAIAGEVRTPATFRVASSGGSNLNLTGLGPSRLTVDASGGCVVTLGGWSRAEVLAASGGSRLELSGLRAVTAELSLSGASTATVRVSEAVSGQLSGGSRLRIMGDPSHRELELSGGSSYDLVPD